jgi:hypothetical protein
MIPINFKEQNKDLQKPHGWDEETECNPLPCWTDGNIVVSCWKPLNFREWIAILFHRKVWLTVYSGVTQPPVSLTGVKQYFREKSE